MVQLILDTEGYNISLPESVKGGYTASLRPLSVDVEMVTGRMVRELRGSVWEIGYQYGYFDDAQKNRVIAACQKGQSQPIRCGFLPQDSAGGLVYADFFVTSFNYPRFMWSRGGAGGQAVPLWADFSMTLRQVQPHD